MKSRVLLLLVCLVLLPFSSYADFSASSTVFDPDLAQYALQIAELGYSPATQESMLRAQGFQQLGVYNSSRNRNDDRHVAAYTVYERATENGSSEVILAIRGTGEGEWKLNLDLMPSGNYDLPYAENFFLAAEDIRTTQEAFLSGLEDPVFLITGFSRGAAVANLLGALLTDRFGGDRVFVYTFATPRTVVGEHASYPNIFNVINPADIITFLPFPAWGFERYGIDIELPVDHETLMTAAREAFLQRSDRNGRSELPLGSLPAVEKTVHTMEALAPGVREGFTVRHALSHPGEALPEEEGMTAGEALLEIFDGSMYSLMHPENGTEPSSFSPNDFSPLLETMQEGARTAGNGWLTDMHQPATYGAWITAISPFLPDDVPSEQK